MSEVEDIVKCSECNSRNLYFDEAIGEKFCKDCGLVLEDEMLEATSSGKEKGGDPDSIRTHSAEIVYYTFKDNGISRSLEEVCAKNSAHPRQVAKSARKIASFFRKPWILSQRNVPSEVEKYCSMLQGDRLFTSNAIKLTVLMFEIGEAKFVSTNDGFIAACIYLAGRLTVGGSFRTQADISRVCNITEVTLRNNLIAVLKLVNLTRDDVFDKMTPLMTLDDFIEGAYERAGKRE
jgi:transcription initiation factor TFIIIB Brf1 subunit/transcription initiation factor TFIIB